MEGLSEKPVSQMMKSEYKRAVKAFVDVAVAICDHGITYICSCIDLLMVTKFNIQITNIYCTPYNLQLPSFSSFLLFLSILSVLFFFLFFFLFFVNRKMSEGITTGSAKRESINVWSLNSQLRVG